MVKPLNVDYYNECVEIFDKLPEDARLSVDDDNWISLFALGINGYTQRHRGFGDIQGGLAGLLTLGRYSGETIVQCKRNCFIILTHYSAGANLCVPQLGLKVTYAPGACTIIRGNGLDHLVQDYTGPRFFVIGTNHETCKKHALRNLGRLPPLPPRSLKRKNNQEGQQAPRDQEDELESPCINLRTDDEDEAGEPGRTS
jgi:hypothetical protein